MWLVPDLVSSIFIHDPETRELARWPMRLLGLTMPIEAMSFAFMHAMLGAGDAKRVMLYVLPPVLFIQTSFGGYPERTG